MTQLVLQRNKNHLHLGGNDLLCGAMRFRADAVEDGRDALERLVHRLGGVDAGVDASLVVVVNKRPRHFVVCVKSLLQYLGVVIFALY
jgi:hypothetical protein